MEEKLNKPEPKKIKMPSLVDRYSDYDIMRCDEHTKVTNEDYHKNNSQSLSELESSKER